MSDNLVGLLAGWKRRDARHCVVVTFKMIDERMTEDGVIGKVSVGISDAQLCSLARDLTRAARERGLEVWPDGGGSRRPVSLLDRLLGKISRPQRGKPTALLPSPGSSVSITH